MSNRVIWQRDNSHRFIFHGQTWPYFIICLVNVVLSIITVGFFLPWAIVRSRRYIYENMTLNGMHFAYKGSGAAILCSWLFIFLVLTLTSLALLIITPLAGGIGALIFLLLMMPFMVVKGLSYHFMMTSLNQIQFGFKCSPLRAWWVMIGMPVLMLTGLIVTIVLFNQAMGAPRSVEGMILQFVLLLLVICVGGCVISGVIYSRWLALIGKGAFFGQQAFSIFVSSKRCIIICLWAMAIMVPFILLFGSILASFFSRMIMGCMFGICNEASGAMLLLANIGSITAGYIVLGCGGVVSMASLQTALRNHAFNNLVLGDSIQFRSTLTFSGMVIRLLALVILSLLTLGLAYPWAKITLLRYLADNTRVEGDLSVLTPTAHSGSPQKPDTLTRLCSGIVL